MADTKRNHLIIWGGGHGDYYGNEIYLLDLNSQTMSLARDATHGSALSSGEANSDGTPTSRHTYDGLEYIPDQDIFTAWSGSLQYSGAFSSTMWTLSASFDWTQKPENGQGTIGESSIPLTAYDPVTKLLFVNATMVPGFWTYQVSTNSWNQVSPDGGCYNLYMTAAIDPARRIFVCVGGGAANSVSLNFPYEKTTLAMQNCGSLMNSSAPGFQYDSVQKLFVGWNGGDKVYLYHPDTDSCESVAFAGGPPPAPSCADSNGQQCEGTYGRFRYFPNLNIFAIVNDIQQNAFVLKLTTP